MASEELVITTFKKQVKRKIAVGVLRLNVKAFDFVGMKIYENLDTVERVSDRFLKLAGRLERLADSLAVVK